jgi:hypothetical protein
MTVIYVADPAWTKEHEQYYWSITDPDGSVRPAYRTLQAMPKDAAAVPLTLSNPPATATPSSGATPAAPTTATAQTPAASTTATPARAATPPPRPSRPVATP